MKYFLKIHFYFSELRRSALFTIGLFLFLLKLAGDSVFFLMGSMDGTGAVIWKFLLSLPLLYIIFIFFFKNFDEKLKDPDKASPGKYFSEVMVLIYLLAGVLVLNFFLPESIENRGNVLSVPALYIVDITACYTVITGVYIIRFLYKWSLIHRHKKTKQYIKYLKYSFILILLFELPYHFDFFNAQVLIENTYSKVVIGIIIILFLSVMFVMTNRNTWIAMLSTGKKWKLFLIGLISIVLAFIIIGLFAGSGEDSKLTSAAYFILGADTIFSWPVLLLLPYFTRILLSVLATLPSTRIVERKTSEVSSLTDLNKIAAKTVHFEELIDTVTKLAMNASGAAGAWTEIYNGDKLNIASLKNIFKQHIEQLHKSGELKNLFLEIHSTYLIEDLSEEPAFSKFPWHNIPFAKSAVIVPLYSSKKRMGSLVILHPEEYGFERSDVEVMTAFANNVSIALENSRLLKDSIEKERYKRELMLAREIQQKLLPQKLPLIENFSIAAFSDPAEEVGGDYYDVVRLKNGKTCIILGDVSGKGISAAFYMAQLKGVVLADAKEAVSPADILQKINSILYSTMEKNMFITLSALMIDGNAGKIKLARAGHMPFIVFRNESVEVITPKGIGIGLVNDDSFIGSIEEIEYNMLPSEVCVVFTDGINEMRNSKNEEFGMENLKQISEKSVYNNSGEAVIEILRNELERFSEGVSHHDDMTALALVYMPEKKSEN